MDTLWSILLVALIALGVLVADSYFGLSGLFKTAAAAA